MRPYLRLGEVRSGLTRLVGRVVVGLNAQNLAVDRTVERPQLLIELDDCLGRVVDVRDKDPQAARLVRVARHVDGLELKLRHPELERVARPHLPGLRRGVQRRRRAKGRCVHEHRLAQAALAAHKLFDVRL